MKKCIALLMSLLLMLLSCTAAVSAEEALDQVSTDGRISVSGGILTVNKSDGVVYKTKQSFSGNYTIEMRAAVDQQAIGLMFGNGNANPAMWSLALVNPFGIWAHMPGGWNDIRKTGDSNVQKGQFVTLKIDIAGSTVTTFINEKQVRTDTVNASNLSGNLGLRFSQNESGRIDYIKVTQNGGVIWEDNFNMIDTDKWNFPRAEASGDPELAELMTPIWSGDVAYEEGVWPVANQDGSIDDIPLLYHADEILKVTNSRETITYQAGSDYRLRDGKLVIPAGSSIPVTAFTEYYPTSGISGATNGRYLFHSEGTGVTDKQIKVTYRHSDAYDGYVPENKSDLLPNTMKKLQKGESLKIVYYGDSITEGYNASSFVNAEPYMPRYTQLITQNLRRAYPNASISEVNTALSGQTATWGVQNVQANVINHNPDLVVLAFGMNDGSHKRSAADFVGDLKSMMTAIKAKRPNCEFVLVSTTLANPESTGFTGTQATFEAEMLKLEQTGVAVARMTTFHQSLMEKKAYIHMTGNNINHPNDWLVRGYAQLVFQTIEEPVIDTEYINVNYVEGSNDPFQTMNIFLPHGRTSGDKFPVLVYAHGGAWVRGEKEGVDEARVFLETARAQGYAVVCINYRYAQNAKWPAQIYDYKAAVRYLRAHAEQYHLDADRIAACGASAGAHLTQMMGVTNGKADYEDLSMGWAEYSSDVQIVLSQYGISNVSTWEMADWLSTITTTGKDPVTTLLGDNYSAKLADSASPIKLVDENTVPFFLSHGQNDDLVQPSQSYTMETKLREVLDDEDLVTFYPTYGPHGDGGYWCTAEPVAKMMNFLNHYFMPEVNSTEDENTRPGYWHVDLSGYTNKHLNLKYANESATQKLHLILPETGEGPYKTIIFVHGGAFAGSNSSGTQVLYTAEGPLQAVEKGYAVALVDYRHATEGYFPDPIHDMKAAIRYLRANAETYGLDADRFAVWGESAGGLIADMIGVTGDDPEFEDLSMGNSDYSSAVQAVVSWYAITDMTTENNAQYCRNYLGFSQNTDLETAKKASPLHNVTKNAPAFYLQHGMADNEVEYSDSVRLYEALITATGNEKTKLDLFPGMTHAVKKFLSKENVDGIIAWLDDTLENPTKPAPDHTPGDVDLSGAVDVGDIMKLKALIMADKWSDEELEIGDMDDSDKLDVGDIMAIKNVIMSK